jgi:hypothetical protein
VVKQQVHLTIIKARIKTMYNTPVVFFGYIDIPSIQKWCYYLSKTSCSHIMSEHGKPWIVRNRLTGILSSNVFSEVILPNSDGSVAYTNKMRQVYARYPILVFSSLQDVCKYFAANQEGLLETKHRLVIVSAPSKYLYEKGIYAVDLSYDDKDKFIIKKRERVSAFRIFKAMLKRDFVFDDMEQQYQTKMSGL